MPIPLDIVAQVNRQSLNDAIGDARRDVDSGGRTLGSTFGNAFGRTASEGVSEGARAGTQVMERETAQAVANMRESLRDGLREAFQGFTSNFRIGEAQSDAMFDKMTSKASLAKLGVAGIGLAAVVVGKQLYDLGATFDDIADGIVVRTGKVGDELNDIMTQVKDAARNAPVPLGDLGDVAGQVVQSLHMTGEPLQAMIENVGNLNDMTGEKLNLREFGKIMRQFKIDINKDGVTTLNQLFNASRDTGIPINDLITSIGNAGPAARDFNMSLGQTAALISTLERAGLDENLLKPALQRLAVFAAKDGKDVRTELERLINDISTLPEEAARKLAASAFGGAAGNFEPIFQAIRDGTIDVQSLTTALDGTGESIKETRDRTSDLSQSWQDLVNTLQIELEPAGTSVFNQINDAVKQTTETLRQEIGEWKALWHTVEDLFTHGGGPSGPARLDSNGNMVPADQPPVGPGGNPLDNIGPGAGAGNRSGAPLPGESPIGDLISGLPGAIAGGGGTSRAGNAPRGQGGGPRNPLDVFAGGGGGANAGGASVRGSDQPAFNIFQQRAITSAQSRAQGQPYAYGHAGEDGQYDCSGIASAIYSDVTGQQVRFMTNSDFASYGFEPGYAPGALNIGTNGGAGTGGHMALTLPNGVNVESGGAANATQYGGGAIGARDFGQVWHLPLTGYAEGGAAPGGGAYVPPFEADNEAQRLTHTGRYTKRFGGVEPWQWGIERGNFRPGIEIDASTTNTPRSMWDEAKVNARSNWNKQRIGWGALRDKMWDVFGPFMVGHNAGGAAHGGTGYKDDVPAVLTGGEHVLTVDDVQAMGGQNAVYRWRQQLHQNFETGGGVDYEPAPGEPGYRPPITSVWEGQYVPWGHGKWPRGVQPFSGRFREGIEIDTSTTTTSGPPKHFDWEKYADSQGLPLSALASLGYSAAPKAAFQDGGDVDGDGYPDDFDDSESWGTPQISKILEMIGAQGSPVGSGWQPRGPFNKRPQWPGEKGSHLPGFDMGGGVPMAVPWGTDPRGAPGDPKQHGDKDSAGPFGPWWDMDWWPPDHPGAISPGQGKWWNRGPTGRKSTFKFPPLGRKPGQRKRTPDDPILGHIDPRIKPWGFEGGGAVPGGGSGVNMNDPGYQMLRTFTDALAGSGGWAGMAGSFADMGLDLAEIQQGQGAAGGPPRPGAGPPGGGKAGAAVSAATGVPGGGGSPQIQGRAAASSAPAAGSVMGLSGAAGAAAGMFPGGSVAASLAARTAQFGAQAIAIGAQGLMETFLPNGSPLGDPGKSMLGRLAMGVSGVRPAGPNTAGQQEAPMQLTSHEGTGAPPGPAPGGGGVGQAAGAPLIGTVNMTTPSDSQAVARDIDRQVRAHGAGQGR